MDNNLNNLNTNIRDLVLKHLEHTNIGSLDELIYVRNDQRGGMLRIVLESGNSVIVKLWRVRNFKELIKYHLRLSNGFREWTMHKCMQRKDISVPKPYYFYHLNLRSGEKWEAMAIEDLGTAEGGLHYLKRMIAENQETQIQLFEKTLINITAQIIKYGIIDIDNQLNNFLVEKSSRLYRIDFECAKKPAIWLLNYKEYGRMVARLLISHIHAVEPDVGRTERFAQLLYDQLNLDSKLKALVIQMVKENREYEKETIGSSYVVTLPN